jgi:hypothetical protein
MTTDQKLSNCPASVKLIRRHSSNFPALTNLANTDPYKSILTSDQILEGSKMDQLNRAYKGNFAEALAVQGWHIPVSYLTSPIGSTTTAQATVRTSYEVERYGAAPDTYCKFFVGRSEQDAHAAMNMCAKKICRIFSIHTPWYWSLDPDDDESLYDDDYTGEGEEVLEAVLK